MMILVGLIFIVVGVNIYHSQRRNVMERREEIGHIADPGGLSAGGKTDFSPRGDSYWYNRVFVGSNCRAAQQLKTSGLFFPPAR